MTHASFLLWMLLFPLLITVESVLRYRFGRPTEPPSEEAQAITALLELATWLIVGYLLY